VNSTLSAPMKAILIWALPVHFAGLLHTRAGDVLNEAALAGQTSNASELKRTLYVWFSFVFFRIMGS
jgi:hypothetical protein